MFRSIPDMNKFKKLYEAIGSNMSINEKNYTYSIYIEPDTAEIIAQNVDHESYVRLDYDINGNLLAVYVDEVEVFIGV